MNDRPHGSFAYAQARMQARLGHLAGGPALRHAREARNLATYLQQVRTSPWSHHVVRLAPDLDVHELEHRLRAQWRATVEEVARWQPREWQPAVLWLCWLPWLPVVQKLARGGRTPAWAREDDVLAQVVAAAGRGARTNRLDATPLRPLREAVAGQSDVVAAWLEHWRRLWPADHAARGELEALIEAVRRADAERADDDATAQAPAPRTLAHVLRRAFRLHPLSVTAAVAFLGLTALDLLELRSAIAVRAAFPTVPS
jgi:hypothetical protein